MKLFSKVIYFSGHALKAAVLDPILLVTSHPVKICALRSTRDFSVPKISADELAF